VSQSLVASKSLAEISGDLPEGVDVPSATIVQSFIFTASLDQTDDVIAGTIEQYVCSYDAHVPGALVKNCSVIVSDGAQRRRLLASKTFIATIDLDPSSTAPIGNVNTTTDVAALASDLGITPGEIEVPEPVAEVKTVEIVSFSETPALSTSLMAGALGVTESALTVTTVVIGPPSPPPSSPPPPPLPPAGKDCGCTEYQQGVGPETDPEDICVKRGTDRNRFGTRVQCTNLQVYYPAKGCSSDHVLCSQLLDPNCADSAGRWASRKCHKKRAKNKCHKRRVMRHCAETCGQC